MFVVLLRQNLLCTVCER